MASVGPGFEWFVAWRHLRDPERRSRTALALGIVLLVLGLACLGAVRFDVARLFGFRAWGGPRSLFIDNLKLIGVVAVLLGVIVTYLGILLRSFTLFTAIAVFGVFIGTWAPVVALSVMSGFEKDLKTKIRGAKADLVVTLPDDRPFTDWVAVRGKLAATPGIVASTPYIESEVMLSSATNPAGVIMKGIDPATAADVLDVGRTLREGSLDHLAHPERIPAAPGLGDLPSDKPHRDGLPEGAMAPSVLHPGTAQAPPARDERDLLPGVILGQELFDKTLHVFVGDELNVACPLCDVGPTGAHPKMRRFRVAGRFYSGMYEFDQKLIYTGLADAQRFLGLPGEVTGIEARVADPARVRQVAQAAQAALGPGYEVRSWEELNAGLFMALKLEKIAMSVVLTFIALVASFSIVSNLIMLVTEKGREVAILKAMGAGDGAVLRIFFAEGLYIGLIGLASGVAFGVGLCWLIQRYGLPLDPNVYYIQQLPVLMRPSEIAGVAAAALALCCAATVYPAILASRMRPVDGLRYE